MALSRLTFRIQCSGTLLGGEVWANVWHARLDETVPNSVWNVGLVDDIEAEFETFYTSVATNAGIDNSWTLEQIVVSDVSGFNSPRFYSPVIVGASTSEAIPTQNAIVISLKTALNSKRGRGRIYLSGFTEEAITGTSSVSLNTADRDVIGNAAATLRDNLETLAMNGPTDLVHLAVYSRVDEESRNVTDIRIGRRFDIQRRRANKQGEAYTTF